MKAHEKIGKQVRKIRESKDISQKELAEKMGTNQSVISELETGKYNPSVQYLERIAKVLKVKFSQLVEG